jgi:hypothetical protein
MERIETRATGKVPPNEPLVSFENGAPSFNCAWTRGKWKGRETAHSRSMLRFPGF